MSEELTVNDVTDFPVWHEDNLLIAFDEKHVFVCDKDDGEAVAIPVEVLKRITRKVNSLDKPDTKTGVMF